MKKPCSIEGCSTLTPRKELCDKHYMRRHVYGDVNYSYKSPEEIAKRFWAQVDTTLGHGPQGECWLFTGRTDKDGYGLCKSAERKGGCTWKAHRYSYFLEHGNVPEGLVIRHSCDNPPCCNPAHLLIGTHGDNAKDKVERGRSLYGERNPKAKLTNQDVFDIRRRALQGEKKVRLSEEYGVTDTSISHICNRRIWKHI